MKLFRKLLTILLVFAMTVSSIAALPALTAQASGTTSVENFMKIVFLDCGRKYYSVDNIKTLIDEAASAGFTHVQLAVGNDGLRFLLDDMSLTSGGKTYSDEQVRSGIQTGNKNYYDLTTNELTESEMDSIISYATGKNIEIIPCINSPGHMDAILDCMEECGLGTVAYNNSARTVDVTNSTATAFTRALIEKYISYFASKGCKYFNMGADEYANDIYTTGSMGFGNLISYGKYGSYVTYVNEMSSLIKSYSMTPMAFNDGIYFNNTTSYGTFDTDILICYWSNGWSGYTPMPASTLVSKGFKLINTHGSYYWVVGNTGWQCSASTAAAFDINTFQGSTITDPYGAMFCIWSDYPGASTDSAVISATSDVVAAFGSALPVSSGSGGDDGGNDGDDGEDDPNTTSGNPFIKGTAGSNSFRIPSLVSLSDGTLVAAADARWNTVYDGGGIDTLTSYSTDMGESWHYSFANYLGDNGDTYNSSSTAYIDPAMAVTSDDTIYMLCDLYPGGVALNGSGNSTPVTSSAFDSSGNLTLTKSSSSSSNKEKTYTYYLNLSDMCIYQSYTSQGKTTTSKVSGYTVDSYFNIKSTSSYVTSCDTNLFCSDSPFTVVKTGYLYLVKSTDKGKTWSEPKLLNLKTTSEMACLVSPGNSIVTSNGTIIFPVYSYNGSDSTQRVSFIYSTDGNSWSRSSSLNYSWGSESECVELSDGTLRFFFRNSTCNICYADATLSSGTWTWSDVTQTSVYVNSNTQISACMYSEKVDGKDAILISAPAGPSDSGSNSSDRTCRVNGKIFTALVNSDGTLDFKYSMSVPSVNSSNQFMYSAMTETTDGNIAILYEDCSTGWGSGDSIYSMMNFKIYGMDEIAPGAVITDDSVSSGRVETNINSGWKFYLGSASNAYTTDYDDSSWTSVDLPHDFSISQSFTTSGEAESGFLPGGTGWYRRSLVLGDSYENKDIIINFDGVYSDAYVYVNGSYVGENHNGYCCFDMDITKYLVCDGQTENVIAVKAVNTIPSSRWYSGSGIYRDVTLTAVSKVHVEPSGVKIETPDISTGTGTVKVTTEIGNTSGKNKNIKVINRVYSAEGKTLLAEGEADLTSVKASVTENVMNLTVADPELWSVDSPSMYRVETLLVLDGVVIDTVENEFGFRWYSFDSSKGFKLNGTYMKLNGVCLHSDEGALGSAEYNDSIYRKLIIMKDMGVNAVRTTHNAADEDLIDICNELGILVVEELYDGWTYAKNGNTYDFSAYFDTEISSDNGIYGAYDGEKWFQFVASNVVRRDRNDPSVIMWSIGNEIFEGCTNTDSSAPDIAQEIIDSIKAEDSTRPATIGDNTRSTSTSTVLGQVINVLINNGGVPGFNYASSSQLSSLASAWGAIYSSETSSATNSRSMYKSQANNSAADSSYHLTSYDTSAVSWGMTAHESIYNTYSMDGVAGEFVWTGFDYIGEPTPYNKTSSGSYVGSDAYPNSSYFGIVDTAGFEKDTYYLYRSQWNRNSNTLHLVTAWDSDNMYTSSGKTPVVIYSNAAKVELYRNGTLIGTATRKVNTTNAGYTYYTYSTVSNSSSVCTAVSGSGSTSLYAQFNVTYSAGTISAKAYDESGNEITDTCSGNYEVNTPGSAALIKLSSDNEDVYNEGIHYIAIDVTDSDGNLDTTYSGKLNITVTGGKILGVDNGDQATTAKYQQSSVLTSDTSAVINAYGGKALVIVKSTGITNVKVTASGLTSDSLCINGEQSETAEEVNITVTAEAYTFTNTDNDGSVENYESKCFTADAGESCTVKFTAGNTEFIGWVNEENTLVSRNEEYTFTPGEDMSLKALCSNYEVSDDGVLVVFVSDYDRVISVVSVTSTSTLTFPNPDVKAGYTFTGWSYDADDISSAISTSKYIKVTPCYEKSGDTHSVSLIYSGLEDMSGRPSNVTYSNVPNSDVQKLEAPQYAGYNFLYYRDSSGNIMSYNDEIDIYSEKDIVVTAVYSTGTVTKAPVLRFYDLTTSCETLDVSTVESTNSGSSTVTRYNINAYEYYEVPDGYELVSAGYIFTLNSASGTESTLRIGGTDVNRCSAKLNSSNYGTYIQHLTTTKASQKVYIRAYLQYKASGEDTVTTVYSSVRSGSYSSL